MDNRKGGIIINNMAILLTCINQVEDPPCMECKIFFYTQSWFNPEEIDDSIDCSLEKSLSLHGKGSSSSSSIGITSSSQV